MSVDDACKLVARELLAELREMLADSMEWEDVPNIGEYDFDRVRDAAVGYLLWSKPPKEHVDAALALLESRCGDAE